MSMVFNVVGGGSKGASDTDAVLHVTVPTGSEVIMARTGMSLTPTIWTSSEDNTKDIAIFFIGSAFFSDSDAWTVTATLSENFVSKTIIISENKKYDMFLAYDFALMTDGAFFDNSSMQTEMKEYSSAQTNAPSYGPQIAKETGYYRIGHTTAAGQGNPTRSGIAYYGNTIDCTPYNYLIIKYKAFNSTTSNNYCKLNMYYSLDTTYASQCDSKTYSLAVGGTTSLMNLTTINIDISNVNRPVYVSFFTYRGQGNFTYIYLYDLIFKTTIET